MLQGDVQVFEHAQDRAAQVEEVAVAVFAELRVAEERDDLDRAARVDQALDVHSVHDVDHPAARVLEACGVDQHLPVAGVATGRQEGGAGRFAVADCLQFLLPLSGPQRALHEAQVDPEQEVAEGALADPGVADHEHDVAVGYAAGDVAADLHEVGYARENFGGRAMLWFDLAGQHAETEQTQARGLQLLQRGCWQIGRVVR